jgi:hypothetical protein
MTRKNTAEIPSLPQSWALSEWSERAPGVYPGDSKKAKYLVRMHKRALLESGALVRIGRELVVVGAPYARWIAKQAVRVSGYSIAANRARQPRPDASA